MKDIIPDISLWFDNEESIALATVIETWGSAPRQPGAKMGLTASGKIAGSVSGGCVETEVIEVGLEVLRTDQPQLLHFGVEDETAWEIGLACGGKLDVFVQPMNMMIFDAIQGLNGRTHATITIVHGPIDWLGKQMLFISNEKTVGSLGDSLDEAAIQAALEAIRQGNSCRLQFGPYPPASHITEKKSAQLTKQPRKPHGDTLSESIEIFIEVTRPQPKLVIVGGVHIAVALTKIAQTLGYSTVLVDPRRAFGNKVRFPNVEQIIHSWPKQALEKIEINSSTAIVVLTHDPKLDDPALQVALPSSAFYVGALGSRVTNAKRRERLIQSGLGMDHLDRLNAPIGIDLGGSTPEEIALAIVAQIVETLNRNPSSTR